MTKEALRQLARAFLAHANSISVGHTYANPYTSAVHMDTRYPHARKRVLLSGAYALAYAFDKEPPEGAVVEFSLEGETDEDARVITHYAAMAAPLIQRKIVGEQTRSNATPHFVHEGKHYYSVPIFQYSNCDLKYDLENNKVVFANAAHESEFKKFFARDNMIMSPNVALAYTRFDVSSIADILKSYKITLDQFPHAIFAQNVTANIEALFCTPPEFMQALKNIFLNQYVDFFKDEETIAGFFALLRQKAVLYKDLERKHMALQLDHVAVVSERDALKTQSLQPQTPVTVTVEVPLPLREGEMVVDKASYQDLINRAAQSAAGEYLEVLKLRQQLIAMERTLTDERNRYEQKIRSLNQEIEDIEGDHIDDELELEGEIDKLKHEIDELKSKAAEKVDTSAPTVGNVALKPEKNVPVNDNEKTERRQESVRRLTIELSAAKKEITGLSFDNERLNKEAANLARSLDAMQKKIKKNSHPVNQGTQTEAVDTEKMVGPSGQIEQTSAINDEEELPIDLFPDDEHDVGESLREKEHDSDPDYPSSEQRSESASPDHSQKIPADHPSVATHENTQKTAEQHEEPALASEKPAQPSESEHSDVNEHGKMFVLAMYAYVYVEERNSEVFHTRNPNDYYNNLEESQRVGILKLAESFAYLKNPAQVKNEIELIAKMLNFHVVALEGQDQLLLAITNSLELMSNKPGCDKVISDDVLLDKYKSIITDIDKLFSADLFSKPFPDGKKFLKINIKSVSQFCNTTSNFVKRMSCSMERIDEMAHLLIDFSEIIRRHPTAAAGHALLTECYLTLKLFHPATYLEPVDFEFQSAKVLAYKRSKHTLTVEDVDQCFTQMWRNTRRDYTSASEARAWSAFKDAYTSKNLATMECNIRVFFRHLRKAFPGRSALKHLMHYYMHVISYMKEEKNRNYAYSGYYTVINRLDNDQRINNKTPDEIVQQFHQQNSAANLFSLPENELSNKNISKVILLIHLKMFYYHSSNAFDLPVWIRKTIYHLENQYRADTALRIIGVLGGLNTTQKPVLPALESSRAAAPPSVPPFDLSSLLHKKMPSQDMIDKFKGVCKERALLAKKKYVEQTSEKPFTPEMLCHFYFDLPVRYFNENPAYQSPFWHNTAIEILLMTLNETKGSAAVRHEDPIYAYLAPIFDAEFLDQVHEQKSQVKKEALIKTKLNQTLQWFYDKNVFRWPKDILENENEQRACLILISTVYVCTLPQNSKSIKSMAHVVNNIKPGHIGKNLQVSSNNTVNSL